MKNISFNTNSVNTRKHLSAYASVRFLFIGLIFSLSACGFNKSTLTADLNNDSPASEIIRFYQGPLDHLSAVRHGGCPMHPNCSAYGISAIKKHGGLIGWMMTFDRLIRCGLDETYLSSEVLVGGKWKYVDTLEQNTFWWCPESRRNGLINIKPSEPLSWGISIE